MGIDDIRCGRDASHITSIVEIFAYNVVMQFKTNEILRDAESLPSDEWSVNSAEREFADADVASTYFSDLRRRLIDIKQWNLNSDSAEYKLYNKDGTVASSGRIRPGLFLRIDLPGSGKSDWVVIENLAISPNEIVITVKPTYDPTEQPPDTGKISHFLSASARNNFCALRDGQFVKVYVIGLHETSNTGHTSGIIETVRNAAVANLGYYLGIQKAVWTSFCNRFLSEDASV